MWHADRLSNSDREILVIDMSMEYCQRDRAAANAMLLKCISIGDTVGRPVVLLFSCAGGRITSAGDRGYLYCGDHLVKTMVEIRKEWAIDGQQFFKRATCKYMMTHGGCGANL